jgi:amphi-Trp domain-containing protein
LIQQAGFIMRKKTQQDLSFRYESIEDKDSIQALLEAVTKGIAKGKLTFSDGEGEILMQPQGLLRLKLTATQQDEMHRVSIRVSWQVDNPVKKKQKPLKVG